MLDYLVITALGLWIVRGLYKTFIEPGLKKSQTWKNWRGRNA